MQDHIKLIERYGYPLYIYDEKKLSNKVEIIKKIFEDFSIYYSIKANPNKRIISFLAKNGLGADCASANEVILAKKCGIKREDILYSSPGKTKDDFAKTVNSATIVADSLNEIDRMDAFFNNKTKIGVRINPKRGFKKEKAFETMGGISSKFGIDEDVFFEELPKLRKYKNIEITGMHVYLGSGILDENVIIDNFYNILEISKRFGYKLDFIDFGGGLGIPYEPNDKELDYTSLKEGITDLLDNYELDETRLIVESGRFLTAECGKYITKIVDIKESQGIKYYIIHGGMNGFFRPTFTKTMHRINIINDENEKETVTIAGHLCTPIDVMEENIEVSKAKVGDYLQVLDAGAYGYTMNLDNFISHAKPKEIYISSSGRELE